jgi:hypothetical protein
MDDEMDKYASKILNMLLDKYEESKSFIGTNQVKQSFYLYPDKEFPRYKDDSDYETFAAINDAIQFLESNSYIQASRERSGVIKRVKLQDTNIPSIYNTLKRKPKEEENEWLNNQLKEIFLKNSPILEKYAESQKIRLAQNKKVEYYENDHREYENILKAVLFAEMNNNEIFIRDASVQLYGDSKYFEKIRKKVQLLMYQYGDFEEKETVLEECGVVKTPTYVAIKGNVILYIAGQTIDLSSFNGDLALSTKTIEDIADIKVFGNRVITIENLTTFHDYDITDGCCIYLGGFHNKIKTMFIKELHQRNPQKEYYHFGDIDAGGFYIYEHLIEKTGIMFQLLHMDIMTLETNRSIWKPLTMNDQKRLGKLIQKLNEKEKKHSLEADYRGTLQYMIDHNCKIEQEGLYAIM